MKEVNVIKEIWEIKQIIDEAIENQDESLFNSAQKRFQELYLTGNYVRSICTTTIDYDPPSIEDMLEDKEKNFSMIAVEVNKDKKRVKGEDIAYLQFQFSSIFELMWWNAWMFDNLNKSVQENFQAQQNKVMYSSIKNNLQEIINYYENFKDEVSIREKETLIEIYNIFMLKFKESFDSVENTL